MLNSLCFGKELEVQEIPENLLRLWASFRSRQGFLSHDRVVLVLCCDRGSLCRDLVLKLHAVARLQHSPSMSRQCFCFSVVTMSDRGFLVATEMVMTRSHVLQLSCCNRFGLGQGFYVATELGQSQGISCCDREILCHDRVS